MWQELVTGLSFIKSNRVLVGVLTSLGVIQLGIGAMQVIWVRFSRTTLGSAPRGWGSWTRYRVLAWR